MLLICWQDNTQPTPCACTQTPAWMWCTSLDPLESAVLQTLYGEACRQYSTFRPAAAYVYARLSGGSGNTQQPAGTETELCRDDFDKLDTKTALQLAAWCFQTVWYHSSGLANTLLHTGALPEASVTARLCTGSHIRGMLHASGVRLKIICW